MSTAFSIQAQTVLAALPRPINRSTGRYVVSDVHGSSRGSRKRKRTELAVGIDGEGLNIYDTKSSKLVTSYALPPQSSFTCPPYSLRRKSAKAGAERRTYISITDATHKIGLYRDCTQPDGTTKATSIFKTQEDRDKQTVFLGLICDEEIAEEDDLLVIKSNGEIQCLNGTDLGTRWISPASTIIKNTTLPDVTSHTVHFAQLTDVYSSKRLLKGREDILLALPTEADSNDGNHVLLLLITSPSDDRLVSERTLHIVALPPRNKIYSSGGTRSIQPLLSIGLPWFQEKQLDQAGIITYNLHMTSGILYQLNGQYLTAFDLSSSQARTYSRVSVEDATSFMPLSNTAVIIASREHVHIYHPKFQSIQASVAIQMTIQMASRKRKMDENDPAYSSPTCNLVAYSPKQSVVYAILGNDLVAFQIEAPQGVPDRRRALGLLIDSIGCGIASASNSIIPKPKRIKLKSFGKYLPASDARFDHAKEDKITEMDRHVVAQDVEAFERLIVNELGMSRDEKKIQQSKKKAVLKPEINGESAANGSKNIINGISKIEAKAASPWMWPKNRSLYSEVHPGWPKYMLSRIFTWSTAPLLEQKRSMHTENTGRLTVVFVPHNVLHWLIVTGHLNQAGVEGALRQELQAAGLRTIPAGQFVEALVEVDPELKMLLPMLSSTCLDFDAFGLLSTIKILMQSLELFEDRHSTDQLLLTNGEMSNHVNRDIETEVELEEERADKALRAAEFHLSDDTSSRGRALSLALEKLYSCPVQDVVSALRSYFTSGEVVSLIYLLRFELARGAWTSRYLDTYQPEGSEEGDSRENTILLVSGLLNCCIDAIGAGGWLSGDAMLVNGNHFESEELIASLKLEVSAALEGIEEASYLKGLTSEIVRYGEAVQKGRPTHKKHSVEASPKRGGQPITLNQGVRDASILPIGMKADQDVSLYRIAAGGEIQQRTARDIGRLKSKKVGKYSRERIVI